MNHEPPAGPQDPGIGFGAFGPVVGSIREPEAARLSIAVLPFTAIGSDPHDHYLADGITDDLITSLSQVSGTLVIGRSTMFTYRGRTADPRDVGRDLNVRHVVAGSLRRADKRLQVNVELVDASNGAHQWAERFEHESLAWQALSGIISGRIARTLNLELMSVGSRATDVRSPRPPQSAEMAMRGWVELFTKPQTRETNDTARRWLNEALAMDPDLALGWTGLAYVSYRAATFGWMNESMQVGLRQGIQHAQRALAVDSRSADAYYVMGQCLNGLDELESAQGAHETCIRLNASHAPAYAALGQVRMFLGFPEETAPLCARAFVLSPREPLRAIWFRSRGLAALFLGDAAAAAQDANTALDINPGYASAHVLLAAAAVRLGQPDIAAEALARLPAISGYRTLEDVRRALARPRRKRFSEFLEQMLDSLREAGLRS